MQQESGQAADRDEEDNPADVVQAARLNGFIKVLGMGSVMSLVFAGVVLLFPARYPVLNSVGAVLVGLILQGIARRLRRTRTIEPWMQWIPSPLATLVWGSAVYYNGSYALTSIGILMAFHYVFLPRAASRWMCGLTLLIAALPLMSAGGIDLKLWTRQVVWAVVALVAIEMIGHRVSLLLDQIAKAGKRLQDQNRQLRDTQVELLRARDAAEEASRAKSRFVANMSHEIRTPMHAVMGLLQLLQNTHQDQRQRDYIDKAYAAAQSLLGILNDILDFSKIEAGKVELDQTTFKVAEVMDPLATMLSAMNRDKDVEILFDHDGDLDVPVIGDALRLQQVLINLTGNAVKFTQQGSVVVGVRAQELTPSTVRIEFSVTDTGIGISREQLASLCQPFQQADASTTRRFGGTGLGLVISQRLLGLMGSQLEIESEPGQGSRFRFALELPRGAELASVPVTIAAPLRVLVVDHSPLARELLGRLIVRMGWQVETTAENSAALARLALMNGVPGEGEPPIDLVLLEHHLPALDALDTIERIRRSPLRQQPRIGLLTNRIDPALPAQLLQRGLTLDAIITKPVCSTSLRAMASDSPRHVVSQALPRRLTGLRLLLVEDNLVNQEVARALLAQEGAQVDIASDGSDGVAMARDQKPPHDLVLMDMLMPVMDGLEATRALRTSGYRQPILAMTANAMDQDRQSCLDAGMTDHISKPVEQDALVSKILALCISPAANR
jgi:signal transduction histidine kinase/DNA-binding response OmpR family regulator